MRALHLLALAAAIAAAGAACGGDDDGNGPENQPPVANFDAPTCEQLVCTFTDISTDDTPPIASREWTFESGTPPSSAEPTQVVTFPETGTYTVTLRVTDNEGASDDFTREVAVEGAPPVNQPPVASFTVSCLSLDCTFTNTSSDDVGITSHSWVFSDGATSTEVSPTHSFTATSLTEVSATLTVTDGGGLTDDQARTFTVSPPASCTGGACDLTLEADASVTITLTNEECNADGNTLRIIEPVELTLFEDGCHTPIPTSFDLGTPGQVFAAGTQIQPEVISGSDDLGFPPTLRIKEGTGWPTWVLEFDDGENCPPSDPTCGEPDFNDLEITITASPQ